MEKETRIIIEFFGNYKETEANDLIDDVSQLCMRRDPSDQPLAYCETKNKDGVWVRAK